MSFEEVPVDISQEELSKVHQTEARDVVLPASIEAMISESFEQDEQRNRRLANVAMKPAKKKDVQ